MKYRVVKFFTDLQDDSHAYNVGDEYPRQGLTVPNARIKELSGSQNKQHTPLIAIVDDEPEPEVKSVAEIEEPKKTRSRKKK